MFKRTLNSNDTGLKRYNGRTVTIHEVIRRPDATHDAEALPMFKCTIEGVVGYIELWINEIKP